MSKILLEQVWNSIVDTAVPHSIVSPVAHSPWATAARQAEQLFERSFGRPTKVVAYAPGRVNVIGEHIDYNDGYVMPMAIDRYVAVAMSPREMSGFPSRLVSAQSPDRVTEVMLGRDRPSTSDWPKYIEGVAKGFSNAGADIPAVDLAVASTLPVGAGLSSSAALEVAAAKAFQSLLELDWSGEKIALLCQQAEHDFAGVPCGIMDQFSSVFGEDGKLLMIDCVSRQVATVDCPDPDIAFLVINTNVHHELSTGEYAIRREQCDRAKETLQTDSWRDVSEAELDGISDIVLRSRANHIVSEIARTRAAAKAFSQSQFETVGELMKQSHHSLRCDFQVSCRELDWLADRMNSFSASSGVFGSRMTGGGFGGSTISLVRRDRVEALMQSVLPEYEAQFGRAADAFVTRPSEGAGICSMASKHGSDQSV